MASSLCSDAKNWDDYILVSQDGDLPAAEGRGGRRAPTEHTPPIRRARGLVRMEPEGSAGSFHDPLMAGTPSGSSSPDEGSTHSKDSDFTIVNPNDLWTSKSPLSSPYTGIVSNTEGMIEENWLYDQSGESAVFGGPPPDPLLAKKLHTWTVTLPVTDTLYSVSLTVICATLVQSKLMMYAISSP